MELSIDTSTRFASVGLSTKGHVSATMTWRSQQNHSVELVPAIMALMDRAKVRRSQLDAVFVAVGPGGFSALRVGISTAKAMAVALDLPVVSVGTLDVEARPYLGLGLPVCALIEAGRERVYRGLYEVANSKPLSEVVAVDELGPDVEPTLYCGEAVSALGGVLSKRLGHGARIVDVPPPTRSLSVLAAIACGRLDRGETSDRETLQPVYLRSAQVNTADRTWPKG